MAEEKVCCRQNEAPKDVHALMPRTCENVPLYGKGDFTDVIS